MFPLLSRTLPVAVALLVSCRTTSPLTRKAPLPLTLSPSQIEIALLTAVRGERLSSSLVTEREAMAQPYNALCPSAPGKSGWRCEAFSPGLIHAGYARGRHYLRVAIRFDDRSYTIRIVRSENLLQSGGEIHKTANLWTSELNMWIQAALAWVPRWGGHFEVIPPETGSPEISNSIIVDQPRDEVWRRFVGGVGKTFFVVNNIDPVSGFVNLSYSGDPERYVDCGEIRSTYKSRNGVYAYAGPVARDNYTYLFLGEHGGLYPMYGDASATGRMNVVVEPAPGNQTRITATARYVVSIDINQGQTSLSERQEAESLRAVTRPAGPKGDDTYDAVYDDTLTFNTNGVGSSPTFSCQPTGAFEAEVLELAR